MHHVPKLPRDREKSDMKMMTDGRRLWTQIRFSFCP